MYKNEYDKQYVMNEVSILQEELNEERNKDLL